MFTPMLEKSMSQNELLWCLNNNIKLNWVVKNRKEIFLIPQISLKNIS